MIDRMSRQIFTLLGAILAFSPLAAQEQPEWQSQYAIGLNKLQPHTYVWPYATVTDVEQGDYEQSPYYLSLNGKWKFHWVKNPDKRPKEFINRLFIPVVGRTFLFPVIGNVRGTVMAIYVNESKGV